MTKHNVTQDDEQPRKPRKERVIHTRVPAVLEQELKRLATSLRVPVSNVVRTILQDAVHTLDSVGEMAEDELRSVAERVAKHRDQLRRKPAPSDAGGDAADVEDGDVISAPLAGVVGYQQMLLARDERCTLCGKRLAAGSQAYLGIREVAGKRVILDEACLPFSAANAANPNTEE